MRKANQFAQAADLFFDTATETAELADAYVTLAVHAGIAAADVICIRRLGQYSATGRHDESVGLLERADTAAASHLRKLLTTKTKAGYSVRSVSTDDVSKARRAHLALLDAARAAR